MVSFPLDADTSRPPDFALLRNGGLALYLAEGALHASEQELAELGYVHRRLDASQWDERAMHESFAATLDFPTYFGHNLNALADCLYDVGHGDYGWDASAAGLAVTITGWERFTKTDPALAHAVADVLAQATASALLFGHRLIWLLRADEPDYRLEPVGAFVVPWNGREWLDASRR